MQLLAFMLKYPQVHHRWLFRQDTKDGYELNSPWPTQSNGRHSVAGALELDDV